MVIPGRPVTTGRPLAMIAPKKPYKKSARSPAVDVENKGIKFKLSF